MPPASEWAFAAWALAPTTLPPAEVLRWEVESFKHQVAAFRAAAATPNHLLPPVSAAVVWIPAKRE
jgi:hypothetical protein